MKRPDSEFAKETARNSGSQGSPAKGFSHHNLLGRSGTIGGVAKLGVNPKTVAENQIPMEGDGENKP